MSSELRSLVWKEWRERKLALAVGTAWIVCGTLYVTAYALALGHRAPTGGFYGTCLLYGLVAAVFLAMRTSLGERTDGTLGFSSALPVSSRRLAALRLGGAVVTLAGPIMLGGLLLSFALLAGVLEQAPPRPPETLGVLIPRLPERPSLPPLAAVGLLWTVTAIAAASGVELLLILSLFGARRRAEAHVGFIGVVLGLVWLLSMGLRYGLEESPLADWSDWAGAIAPQSLVIARSYARYTDVDVAVMLWRPLAVNLLVLTALGIWFTRRYGTGEHAEGALRPGRRWGIPALLSRLTVRWPARVPALVWLDLRQALPLAVTGLMLAFLLTIGSVAIDDAGFGARFPERLRAELPSTTWFVAVLWGAIVGSGVFAAEVQPRLGHFWRSRPIPATVWFWVKYAVGLFAVLAVLDGITILVSWNATDPRNVDRMSWSYLACMPLVHAATYSLAVLAVCRLRRPVLAAALAVGAWPLTSVTLEAVPGAGRFEPINVYNSLVHAELRGAFDLGAHHYPLVYGTVAAVIILATVLAWRSSLRD